MTHEVTMAENTLISLKQAIVQLIPAESFDKFKNFIASASLANNDLNLASAQSITQAFMDCANSGLMPDGREAAIVTRYDKTAKCHVATFQPMVKGAVRIIHESPKIKSFNVKTVYNEDVFEMWADEGGDHLTYKPSFEANRVDSNIKLFYASATLANGSVIIEVMTRSQVDKHMASAKQAYIWKAWYGEMGTKTIIHRILKRLPVANPEIMQGLENSLDIDLSAPSKPEAIASNHSANTDKREPYPQDRFDGMTPKWTKAITSGKKTVDELIKSIESSFILSDDQKLAIAELGIIETQYEEQSA